MERKMKVFMDESKQKRRQVTRPDEDLSDPEQRDHC